MMRLLGGVIAGYVVMAALIFIIFSLAYSVLGVEGAFQKESYAVSQSWIIVSVVGGLCAAACGGFVALLIGRDLKTNQFLALLVLVLGLALAAPELTRPAEGPAEPRTTGLSNNEAMRQAKQPQWLVLLNPFIGAAGVIIGGRMHK